LWIVSCLVPRYRICRQFSLRGTLFSRLPHEEDWLPWTVGLGSELAAVRSLSCLAGSYDMGAHRPGVSLRPADAMAQESLSPDRFSLPGKHYLERDSGCPHLIPVLKLAHC